MRHGSLFSGIGGFDLAASWVGWENIFQVEIDSFCLHVLKTHFPYSRKYEDIRKFKGTSYHGAIDIISGGFPCQPFSIAGQRLGHEDDRYLWPEMLRIIDEIKPTWIVGENVAGILSMVQSGMPVNMGSQTCLSQEDQEIITKHEFITESICKDFERIGYSVQPFLIPACGKSAPHQRNRIWFVAYSCNKIQRQESTARAEKNINCDRTKIFTRPGTTGESRIITHPYSKGLEGTASQILQRGSRQSSGTYPIPTWDGWPTQPAVCRRDDGISAQLVNISFSRWRKESIRAFGNAIVPQVAFEIFSAIQSVNNLIQQDL